MNNKLSELLTEISVLEAELFKELQKQQDELAFEFRKKRVYFDDKIVARQKQLVKGIFRYLQDAPLKHIATIPVIWSCLLPALIMDVFVTIYQFLCFPVYGIPKVKRSDYLVFDRQYLQYLNFIEKINCFYCSYFSGLISYTQEIVARTEQFWCPIKHAKHIKNLHGRYHVFFKYGDAKYYRDNVQNVRRDFSDLE